MFRKLLVPLDGSELAERALPYAVTLARANGGTLTLVRVALAPPPATLDGAGWESDQEEAITTAEQYLATIAERLRTRVQVNTTVPYGRAVAGVLESIVATNADAVVMATHGRTGLKHLLLGSVAEAVIASSAVPVFTVYAQPGETPAAPFDPTGARVVVPLDGSTFSETAIPMAVELVGARGELVLVTVVEPPQQVERDEFGQVRAYLDQQEEAATRDAREYLMDVQTRIVQKYPGKQVRVEVRVGEPSSGIIVAAADRAADLVVMASHGRTGVARAFFGSVAGTVLRDGTTPVLVVHPRLEAPTTTLPQPIEERVAVHS